MEKMEIEGERERIKSVEKRWVTSENDKSNFESLSQFFDQFQSNDRKEWSMCSFTNGSWAVDFASIDDPTAFIADLCAFLE